MVLKYLMFFEIEENINFKVSLWLKYDGNQQRLNLNQPHRKNSYFFINLGQLAQLIGSTNIHLVEQ